MNKKYTMDDYHGSDGYLMGRARGYVIVCEECLAPMLPPRDVMDPDKPSDRIILQWMNAPCEKSADGALPHWFVRVPRTGI